MMKNWFNQFNGLQRLFLSVLVILIVFTLIAFKFYSVENIIVILVFIVFVLYITRSVWQIHPSHRNKIGLASIALAVTTIGSFGFWQQYTSQIINKILLKYFNVKLTDPASSVADIVILAFALLVIFLVNYYNQDKSTLGESVGKIKVDVPERAFKEKVETVSLALEDMLKSIDLRTNWSNEYYVSLDAEVEIISTTNRKRIVSDLLEAIRASSERLFLVIGDPGSGKSVALRKLARDLLKEVPKTGKIPIYINLKEWQPSGKWSIENLPNINDLKKFVFNYLVTYDIVMSEFFINYFDILYDNGRLYFIFDSFDEIPFILEEQEDSELIDYLSELIFIFLKGARSKESQGVLSSRPFRKPTHLFQTTIVLEILPLSETKIVDNLKRRLDQNDSVIRDIFKSRYDLIVILKNPFLSSLFINFLKKNSNQLPDSQFIMYSSYIDNVLESSVIKMKELQVTKADIVEYAVFISNEMFSNSTLELSLDYISDKYQNKRLLNTIEILKFTRMIRGNESNSLFSFSHRRFAEFFYVKGMLSSEETIDLNVIPNDTQSRDALVLFCQIAPHEVAVKIAKFCWVVISSDTNFKNKETLNCIRFLNDAFFGRKNCIESFEDELSHLIKTYVDSRGNMISTKIALESVSLLSESNLDSIVTKVFSYDNEWINDTAVKSCRHLVKISTLLEGNLHDYVSTIPFNDLLKGRFKELYFSLSLSDAFKRIRRTLFLRAFDFIGNAFFILFIYIMPLFYAINLSKKSVGQVDVFFLLCFFLYALLKANLPIFSVVYSAKSKKRLKDVLIVFTILPTFGFLFLLGFYYLSKSNYIEYIKIFFRYATYVIGPIALLAVLYVFFRELIVFLKDLLVFREKKFYHTMDRSRIHADIISLNTIYFRGKYIDSLSVNTKVVSGAWPDDDFLDMTSDSVLIRLARLDEKWMKLDK